MSQLSSHREPSRNGTNGHVDTADAPASVLDEWGTDDALRLEMERLAAENQHLLAGSGLAPQEHGEPGAAELEQLRGENAELRQRMGELEHALLERPANEEEWVDRQREYETLLEEKSEVIRSLHQKMQELREAAVPAPAVDRGRPMDPAQHEDLLLLKRQLEEERGQLEQDEESLMLQMRQMEMTMSRERAEIARQRSELQRLHNDLRHEMELAARDAHLRERLAPLQRRQQEVAGRQGGAAASETPAPTPTPAAADPKKNSGLLRRLFGSKDQ